MNDPFLLATLKTPLSIPFLIVAFFIAQFSVTVQLIINALKVHIKQLKTLAKPEKYTHIFMLLVSIIIFLSSVFLIFHKMTELPSGGFDADDGVYVIGGYFLKKTASDSLEHKIPFYPKLLVSYHGQVLQDVALKGIPVYMQVFTQYFTKAGFYSFRLECSLIVLITSIILICTILILTNSIIASLLGGALFNILPWTKILSRITPESTSYCFGAACFLFSLIYFINKKNFLSFLLYLVSLAIFFQSYTPAFMLAPLCGVVLPLVLIQHSKDYKKSSILLIIVGLLLLGLMFNTFHNEEGYKWNLGRARSSVCLEGLESFNIQQIYTGLKEKWQVYTANYIAYLMPHFLFFTGDSNLRHNPGYGGQLFASLFIAFYVGFIYLIENMKQNINLKIILVFLLLSTIPYSICIEGGLDLATRLPLHALRQSAMLPPVTIITILGLFQIFKNKKTLFFIYILIISFNIKLFYNYYFNVYPHRLGNSVFDDAGLRVVSKKAFEILKKNPDKKLFATCHLLSISYPNVETIGIEGISKGNGLLSNVYHYYSRGDIEPTKGDLIIVQEPFRYNDLTKGVKDIMRVSNPALPGNAFGASLFEVTD